MKTKERFRAVALRKGGESVKRIAARLGVAPSTVSLWVRDIEPGAKARERLLRRIKIGQLVAAEKRKARTAAIEQGYLEDATREIKEYPNHNKIMCAMLYWCEGTKNPKASMTFTNSDPKLVATFLVLLRKSFLLDESKFHPCIHIHEYHSARQQLDFWSKVTKIDRRQFIRPYRKPHTGKRIHPGYQGCISLKYHSVDLARRIIATAKAFLSHTGA